MASKLRFHPLVATELAAALDWYDEISIELGKRLRIAVDQTIKEITQSPERFPYAFNDSELRYRTVRKFPYLVLYVVRPDAIHLRGLVHTSSDSEKWRSRIGG